MLSTRAGGLLATLPKAHLHLHFTGSMRHATLVDLAARHRLHLPEALTAEWPPQLSASDERGWFRFQRLYDIARSVVRTKPDVRRLLLEAAEDERAEGSGWLELQIDPSGYACRFGGLTPMLELVLESAAAAQAATGVGIGIIVAANRTKHPLEARTLARLAAAYAGNGVVGFGLSNDERRGNVADFGRRSGSRPRPACGRYRTAASWPGPRASGPAWTSCTPTASDTVWRRPGIRPCWPGSRPRASPWKSARPQMSRWASPRPRRTCPSVRCSEPARS